jgi:hypothetical protein
MNPRKLGLAISVFFVVCAVSLTAFTQQLPRLPDLQIPNGPPKTEQEQLRVPSLREIANGSTRATMQSNTNGGSRQGLVDGTAEFKRRQEERGETVRLESTTNTIPYWSDSFDYHGLRYTYTMVGTDPKRGSATTVIPVEIIPIRWVFSNGMVVDASTDIVDGQTPVQGIVNSPIFQDYDFTSGGTHVGNTQYGDAFQRANFWNWVSTRSPDYHVRLATPTVLPTQTVVVPDDKVTFFTTGSGAVVPLIDISFIGGVEFNLHASLGISPESLPITVWGSIGAGGALGYHGSYQTGNSIQTFMSTSYFPRGTWGGEISGLSDVAALSHEIIEWMDDPFINFSAGWNQPFHIYEPPPSEVRCESQYAFDTLEVADPFEYLGPYTNASVPTNGFTYHLAEGAFIDFFTRAKRSRSVNGQYSFFEVGRQFGQGDTPPSPDCVSSVYTDDQFFTVPGAVLTFALGMNNTGSVVGYYFDAAHKLHGFEKDRFGYTTIDVPGAFRTIPRDINDGGTIVGNYFGTDHISHGFSYKNGRFTTIDFPGSVDTLPEKINSQGVIVGAYDITQPITHGFVLDSRGFQAVDTPFGTQSEAASVNDLGIIAGNSWTDPYSGLQSGFIKSGESLTKFDFPDESFTVLASINTFGDLGGYYIDSSSIPNGFVRLFGYPYVIQQFGYETYVLDINDNKEILGWTVNFDTWEGQPFIGRPALASGN